MSFIGLGQNPGVLWLFFTTNDMRIQRRVAIFAVFKTTNMALNVEQVLAALEEEDFDMDGGGI